uniref:Leucine rich repeat containing 74A n=1 Tax=Latimeria chalumnae TaxID=7897 RepID=H3B3F3_LATCH
MSESELSLESLSLKELSSECLEEEQPNENEWDTDLEIEEVKERSGSLNEKDMYLQACKLVGVVPVSYFLRHLDNPHLNLNHHGLGPQGAKAIAIAMVNNTMVTNLELEDNWITGEGTSYIVEMLKENCYIQQLNISNNHLQFRGAELISILLHNNYSLRSINLSGNGFQENSAKVLCEVLATNYNMKEMDLSHNSFREQGGEFLGQMLATNEGMEVLNLSWNNLRMKGAVALCAGLRANTMLKYLDLSWNGFGAEGSVAMGEALKFNATLVYLDLSNNRINNEGAKMLCKGLDANESLKVLKLAHNPLTVEGALNLLTVLKNSQKSVLEQLNIGNVLVNEAFLQLRDATRQVKPGLEVIFGGVGGFIAKKPKPRPDPMKVIQDYLDERKLRLWDFFRNIDKDGSMKVPVSDFQKAIQQSDIPLNRNQIEELVVKLDKDKTGMVDYRLISTFMI